MAEENGKVLLIAEVALNVVRAESSATSTATSNGTGLAADSASCSNLADPSNNCETTSMDDIYIFLAHAVQLEMEAARRFEELAEQMRSAGNTEVQEFFQRMAEFSRRHLSEAKARSGFRPLPDLKPGEFEWPDGISPETAPWSGVDGMMGVEDALQIALESERAGHAFYATVAANTSNPRVKRAADEFTLEEAEHVAELERWMVRYGIPS